MWLEHFSFVDNHPVHPIAIGQCIFNEHSLFVGKNSSGKSLIMDKIKMVHRLLQGRKPFDVKSDIKVQIGWRNKTEKYFCELSCKNGNLCIDKFTIDGVERDYSMFLEIPKTWNVKFVDPANEKQKRKFPPKCSYDHVNGETYHKLFLSEMIEDMKKIGFDNDESVFTSWGYNIAYRTLFMIKHFIWREEPISLFIDNFNLGLDFEKARRLSELVLAKIEHTSVQLIAATNNRNAMNIFGLDNWNLLEKNGNVINVYNEKNHQNIFEEFKFTGLDNADFLYFDYVNSQNTTDNIDTAEEET